MVTKINAELAKAIIPESQRLAEAIGFINGYMAALRLKKWLTVSDSDNTLINEGGSNGKSNR